MAFNLNDDGVTVIRLRHVEMKSDGSFQYRRRIPKSLKDHFPRKLFFVRSLGRDKGSLSKQCYNVSQILEAEWIRLGWSRVTAEQQPDSGDILLLDSQRIASAVLGFPTLSSSLSLYLDLHSNASFPRFRSDCTRIVTQVITLVGDLPLNVYTRSHAEIVRDALLKTGTTSTVRRRLTSLTAIVNKVRKEKQLQMLNPFEGLGIVGEGDDETKRVPFTGDELKIVSTHCRHFDDDIRHIVALQLDTGCRVAEIVGLRVEDVILDHVVPHIRIRPFGKVRTLKTAASERDIPLIGCALWAAQRAVEGRRRIKDKSLWLFPRYASDKEIKATHASNTLNKWIRSLSGVCDTKTTHCFRHAMRDRLRAVQVPHDIQEAIGGWGTRTIGQGYGSGYPISVLNEHMQKIGTL